MIAVIGDIHGNLTRLLSILEQCEKFNITKYIFLGDYIDRGKNSKKVIELLISLKEEFGNNCILCKGNHEEMLIESLKQTDSLITSCWYKNGGIECINSYSKTFNNYIDDYPSLLIKHSKFLEENMVEYHIEYIDNISFIFCHNAQNIDVVNKILKKETILIDLWSRQYNSTNMPKRCIQVFGHSFFSYPSINLHDEDDSRGIIGIDTGCARKNGYLTAMLIAEDGNIDFIRSKDKE